MGGGPRRRRALGQLWDGGSVETEMGPLGHPGTQTLALLTLTSLLPTLGQGAQAPGRLPLQAGRFLQQRE